jgi:hypothetical protein
MCSANVILADDALAVTPLFRQTERVREPHDLRIDKVRVCLRQVNEPEPREIVVVAAQDLATG